jgi:gamma-glutamyl-gamma-aminobutyrate hydrolase PuuD
LSNLKKTDKYIGVLKGEAGFESKSVGSLNPEMAKSLAELFEKGIKMLPEILKNLPNLLKQFDNELTKEAIERVDKLIAEGKQNMEEQKNEEMMTPEQIELSREREAESMMTDQQKNDSEDRAATYDQQKAA